MAGDDHLQRQEVSEVHGYRQISSTVVCSYLAGVAIGGPLFGMMGFSFLASLTLLLIISSPLLVVFSPVLFFAGFVFVGAMAGFTVAAAMAVTGLSAQRRG